MSGADADTAPSDLNAFFAARDKKAKKPAAAAAAAPATPTAAPPPKANPSPSSGLQNLSQARGSEHFCTAGALSHTRRSRPTPRRRRRLHPRGMRPRRGGLLPSPSTWPTWPLLAPPRALPVGAAPVARRSRRIRRRTHSMCSTRASEAAGALDRLKNGHAMQVTNSTFEGVFERVATAVTQATFVAVDLEFSGLTQSR